MLGLLTLVGATRADASDRNVLKQFGILGKIAVDCGAPPSRSNPHMHFAVSREGRATRTLNMTDPALDATLEIRNVRLVAPDKMQFNETGRQSELAITIAKIGGKFRSWRSVRADGTVLLADGAPSTIFTPCTTPARQKN